MPRAFTTMQQNLIHKAMLSSARRHPDNIAIKYKGESQTYRDLALSSACIADCLDRFNGQQSDCIALYMDKRTEAIQAIYGILRAGLTYVPLDIQNPVNRLLYIVEQCEIRTYITTPEHIEKLFAFLTECNRSAEIIVLTDATFSINYDDFQVRVIAPCLASSEKFEAYQDKVAGSDQPAAILYSTLR